jgi:acetolactate synthase I/II/III large subunit
VVVVVGDGGVCLYPEAISIAVQKKLPLLLVLMIEGFYSSIRQVAVREELSEEIIKVPRAPWTHLFESMGCPSHRIHSIASLEAAIRSAIENRGPVFMELEFNADEYLAMIEGIR